jgi:hypothetical protein
MGIASECSMGISADPSVSRTMSGRALAMTGDAVRSCAHREVGAVVALQVKSGFCGVADPTHFCYPIAETQESCSVTRGINYNVAGNLNRTPEEMQRRDGKFLVKSRKTVD